LSIVGFRFLYTVQKLEIITGSIGYNIPEIMIILRIRQNTSSKNEMTVFSGQWIHDPDGHAAETDRRIDREPFAVVRQRKTVCYEFHDVHKIYI
jgi:hypothetical protein